MPSKKPAPLTPRSMRRFLVGCAALMFVGGCFLYREELRAPSDYALLALTCAGFVAWVCLALRLNKLIVRLPLVIRALGFAFAVLVLVIANALIRRHVHAEFPIALFSMPFPLLALMPLFNGFFGHSPSAGEKS